MAKQYKEKIKIDEKVYIKIVTSEWILIIKKYCKQSEVKFPVERNKNEVGNKDYMQKVNFTKIIEYLINNKLL